jgi:ABC-type uncharacterized transport system YnjBCD ATPase subunit
MLSFKHLTIENARYSWFGRKRWSPILSDINLTLHRGEIVALVGRQRRRQKPAVTKCSGPSATKFTYARRDPARRQNAR